MSRNIFLFLLALLLCSCGASQQTPIEITATPLPQSPTPIIIVITATMPPATPTFTPTPPPTPTPTPSWRPVAVARVEEALGENGYRRYPFDLDDGSGGFHWTRESSYERITTWDDETIELEVVHDPSASTRADQLDRMFDVLDTVLPSEFMTQLREVHAAYNRSVGPRISGEPFEVQAYGGEWKTVWAEYNVENVAIGGYAVRFSIWWWQSTCPPQYSYCYYADFPGLEFTGDSSMVFHTITFWPLEEGQVITHQALRPTATPNPAIASLESLEGQWVWFAPNLRPFSGSIPYDVYNIFRPEAEWSTGRGQIDVIQFPIADFPRIMPGRPDFLGEDIRPRVEFALNHDLHIAILADGIVDENTNPLGEKELSTACNGEEYALLVLSELRRVYQYGGEVNYLIFDQPFEQHGRGRNPGGCRFTDAELSRQLLTVMKTVRDTYPKIRFGLVENIHCYRVGTYPGGGCGPGHGDLIEVLTTFLGVVREGGEQLDFMHAYLPYDWAISYGGNQGWRKLKVLEDYIQNEGVRFGVVYSSWRGGETSDELFYRDVLRAKIQYQDVGGNPDDCILWSRQDYPKIWLPEDDPYTFTHLLKDFLELSPEEIEAKLSS